MSLPQTRARPQGVWSPDYWRALADDYASACEQIALLFAAMGLPTKAFILHAMSVAEHETRNGLAWPGENNFGAVQLRALNQAELVDYQSGKLHAGSRTTETHRSDVPLGALHVDTHPGPRGAVPYPVWFAAFPTRVEGVSYFLKIFVRLSLITTTPLAIAPADVGLHAHMFEADPSHPLSESAAAVDGATAHDVAAAMYRHGYYEGFAAGARPLAQRTGAFTVPEQLNVDAYAAAMTRCWNVIAPSLASWLPPWEHAAVLEDVHAHVDVPEATAAASSPSSTGSSTPA